MSIKVQDFVRNKGWIHSFIFSHHQEQENINLDLVFAVPAFRRMVECEISIWFEFETTDFPSYSNVLKQCCGEFMTSWSRITNNYCFVQCFRTVCCDCHAPVQLDEMVPWNKSAGSGWSVNSKDLGCRTESHFDQRALVACGGTWAAGEGTGAGAQAGPQRPGSPLVSEVPQVTDPHPHIGATPAGVPVCPDSTYPRCHRALEVFGSGHAMLRPHISMLSAVASCYCINTRPDSRQSREDPKGTGGRASCQESHYVLLSQRQAM